jgi:cell division protein FtsZ
VVTTPFPWENKRTKLAEQVIAELNEYSDCMIIFSNAKLIQNVPRNMPAMEAKEKANEAFYQALSGLLEMLVLEGDINNLDFADVEETLKCKGMALMGVGEATGEDRAKKAYRNAIDSPLMAVNSIKGAHKLLVNVVSDRDMSIEEYDTICTMATAEADPEADVFTGFVCTEFMRPEKAIRVTLIATGMEQEAPGDPTKDGWEAPLQEEVIDLNTIVEEEVEVTTRPEEPQAPQASLPPVASPITVAPPKTRFPRTPLPQTPQPASNVDPRRQIQRGQGTLPNNNLNNLNNINNLPRSQNPPQVNNRYEHHTGVDPVNSDPAKYDVPSFMRKDAS